jgi:hypothetical protein
MVIGFSVRLNLTFGQYELDVETARSFPISGSGRAFRVV